MTVIHSYNDMTVEMMHATPYPAELLALAMSITTQAKDDEIPPLFTESKAHFLVEAEHTSLFEHVVYTFLIQGVSRSFLAQITRQRTASPTSGSQHYQDYSDYPCTVHPDLVTSDPVNHALDDSYTQYARLIAEGVDKSEARQVLPNAACVNYLWTIDARNLFFFLRQRLCYRNVAEMQLFAEKVLTLVKEHFPQLFGWAGPQCAFGECKQGPMQCNFGPWLAMEEPRR